MHVLSSPRTLRGKECHLMVLVAVAALAALWAIRSVAFTVNVDVVEDNIILDLVFGGLFPDLCSEAQFVIDECHV